MIDTAYDRCIIGAFFTEKLGLLTHVLGNLSHNGIARRALLDIRCANSGIQRISKLCPLLGVKMQWEEIKM